jgi:hypothetical protein
VAVVLEVGELVTPLCQDAQRILEESDNDEETADCGEVPVHIDN